MLVFSWKRSSVYVEKHLFLQRHVEIIKTTIDRRWSTRISAPCSSSADTNILRYHHLLVQAKFITERAFPINIYYIGGVPIYKQDEINKIGKKESNYYKPVAFTSCLALIVIFSNLSV